MWIGICKIFKDNSSLTLYSHEWPRQNFSLQYQYIIKHTSDENKEKYQWGWILHTNITRTVWQTVRRITSEILGVKGLTSNCIWNHVVTYTHWTATYHLSLLKLHWIHWIQTDWQLAHWKQIHHSIPLPYSTWHLSNFLIFYQNLSPHLSCWSCILQ